MTMRAKSVLFVMILICAGCKNAPNDDAENGEYEFVQDSRQWVMMIQGDTQSIGKLDESGEFVADRAFLQQERHKQSSVEPDYVVINAPAQKGVYEFRSGRLIPGDLDEDGNFIPTLGSRVIDFNDYHYSPKAPKIYNLPGKFVRKGKKDEK
jgi:hypothetical protein